VLVLGGCVVKERRRSRIYQEMLVLIRQPVPIFRAGDLIASTLNDSEKDLSVMVDKFEGVRQSKQLRTIEQSK